MNQNGFLRIFLIMTMACISAVANARWYHGPGGSGGGDPHAIEFLKLADNLAEWLKGTSDLSSIDRMHFRDEVANLRASLDLPIAIPRLRFTDERVLCRGIPKIGCTEDRIVTIHRSEWKDLRLSEKYELVAQEILVLMGSLANRYSLAEEIGRNTMAIEESAASKDLFPPQKFSIVSVSNASRFEGLNASPIIFGGIDGSLDVGTCRHRANDSTCDNCGGDLRACNYKRIFGELELKFALHSEGAEGDIVVLRPGSSLPVELSPSSDRSITRNQNALIALKWKTICSAMDTRIVNPGTCELAPGHHVAQSSFLIYVGNQTVSIHIKILRSGLDYEPSFAARSCADGPALDFEMYPGDQSAYFDDPIVCSVFPEYPSGRARFIRVLHEAETAGGFSAVTAASPSQDLSVLNDSSLDQSIISGLRNGVNYFFKAALVDEAGNAAYFTGPDGDEPAHTARPELARGSIKN